MGVEREPPASPELEDLGALRHSLPYDSYAFLPDQASHTLRDHFKVQSLDGFGCADMPAAVSAASSAWS